MAITVFSQLNWIWVLSWNKKFVELLYLPIYSQYLISPIWVSFPLLKCGLWNSWKSFCWHNPRSLGLQPPDPAHRDTGIPMPLCNSAHPFTGLFSTRLSTTDDFQSLSPCRLSFPSAIPPLVLAKKFSAIFIQMTDLSFTALPFRCLLSRSAG